jgi:hypothetical protein
VTIGPWGPRIRQWIGGGRLARIDHGEVFTDIGRRINVSPRQRGCPEGAESMDTNTWLQNSNDANSGDNAPGDGRSSLGRQIDTALGEFDAKLEQLRETLDDRKSEIEELEDEIARTEKEQAKAFKTLLSKNTQIKKMLDPKGKSRPSRRKKAAPKPQTQTEAEPADDFPFGGV